MRLNRSLLALAVLAIAAVPIHAPAQVESTPIPAPAKPNFSSMEFLIGTWTCSTKSARRPSAYTTISTYKMDPSGWYIDETSTTKANSSWIPTTLTQLDRYTYDSMTHRWVDITYGNDGAYGLSFSSGLHGNRMSWHDVSFAPGPDVKSQTDTVFTKESDSKMTATSSFTETKTGRNVAVSTVCAK